MRAGSLQYWVKFRLLIRLLSRLVSFVKDVNFTVFSCRRAIHDTAYFPWDINAEKAHINMIKNESLVSHCIASKLAILVLFLDFEALSYLTENNITNQCVHVSWLGRPSSFIWMCPVHQAQWTQSTKFTPILLHRIFIAGVECTYHIKQKQL